MALTEHEITRGTGETNGTDPEKSAAVLESSSVEGSNESTHGKRKTERSGFFHWHEPGTSKEEKRLIFKLDFFILTYACLAFFVKQLDQNNVNNAYSSGMSEELKFGPGNELSWMNTYFTIGTLIGSPFGTLAMSKIPPRYWLPANMFMWSFFVLFLYKCNTASQFYALRVSRQLRIS